ncbi:amidohydrolase [Prauserella sp. PE36]|uniref:Amidohydrolase n=1 Tax=Prauserella endophytica TaxID=1592324 RepID=A0ABY2S2Z9_9PSEU|nr:MULTISPECIES: M20 family metallopeptidase [Prauserella]PXY34392.1 amidohydrolase [Prauserella coralliicola]RBM23159.1 amidohydrolase [Prauserella sp. PE36]TKG69915.1 amidohydrolase [Prauserella endophytica]
MTGPTELPSLPDARFAGLRAEAEALQPTTIALRRRLHRHPEIGLSLPRSQEAVLAAIDDLPLEITRGRSTTSVTAVLRGARPGPAVLLRGDMDALPMPEDTGAEFASEVAGAMHACGHDTHVAMLASAARLLAGHTEELAGSVVFMFQPGEEGYHGARHMIHEGVLDAAGSRVERALGLHIFANLPSGRIATRPGPIMASADSFHVKVTGRGGHGSMPQNAVDPVPAAAAMVGALQTMITRRIGVFDPAVLSVTRIEAGTTTNVIPETAVLEGTIRTLSERTRSLVHAELHKVCEGVAAAHGCRVLPDIEPGYPTTVNDAEEASRVLALAGEVLGADNAVEMPDPIMGAEDFSYVLQRVPGAFAFLGACPPDTTPDEAAPNHSNRVHYDEAAMANGVAMYAAFALDALR